MRVTETSGVVRWEPPASAGGIWTLVQRKKRSILTWVLALGPLDAGALALAIPGG